MYQERARAKAVRWLYHEPNVLGLPVKGNPLGDPDVTSPFVRLVVNHYTRIRHEDAGDRRANGTLDVDVKRVGYQLASAIRMAVQDNNLILAYNTLGDTASDTMPSYLKGMRPVHGQFILLPLLPEMIVSACT
jgi:hypothetical protein